MKYVPPYGREAEGDAAHYINGNPAEGQQGSIPPANTFEHPMREIVGVIDKSLITSSTTDLLQLAKAIRSQRLNYAEDTGSANTLSVAYDPPIVSYSIGLPLFVKIHTTNTGPSTIDAGGGRVQIRRPNGSQVSSGDLPAAGLAELVYDGSAFQMINFGGAGGGTGGSTFYYNIPYTVDIGTPNLIVANFSPAVTALVAGTILMVKAANTNTGITQINVQGMGVKPVYALGGADLLPSDVIIGDVLILTYDGTRFWINPNPIINQNSTINIPSRFATLAAAFDALARKRIMPSATLTLQLATGIITGPQQTFHIDSDRIIVQGTMLGANPTQSDFAKTGNGSAARIADSANNIAMLRTRYGTEIRWQNSDLFGLNHISVGRITYRNLLVSGQNISAGGAIGRTAAINPPRGGSIFCDNVAVWGSGGYGFVAIENTIDCNYCWACGNFGDGFLAYSAGSMVIYNCGSFGNAYNGFEAYNGGQINWSINPSYSQMNGQYGAYVGTLSTLLMATGSICLGNALADIIADTVATAVCYTGTASVLSPPANTTGNNGAFIRVI